MQAGKVVLPLEAEDRRQGTKIYPVLKAVAHRILTLICIFLFWLKSFLLDAWLWRIFPLFTYNPYLAGYSTKAWQRRASGNQHLISWSWSASETSWMLHSNDFFSTVQEHTTYHKRATGKSSKSVCKGHARLSPTALHPKCSEHEMHKQCLLYMVGNGKCQCFFSNTMQKQTNHL